MSIATSWHDLARTVRRHRALLAAGLTAAAVAAGLPVLAPDPGPTLTIVAAARDLAPGSPLTKEDLTQVVLPRTLAPEGAATDPSALLGRVLSGPVRRGEPLTDVRLLGSGLLTGRGLVAVPVRLADGATLALLHAGDRVDVLAASTGQQQTAAAETVAAGVEVLAVPGGQDRNADGGLIVVAATPATAARLAAAAVGARLSITVLAS